MNWWIISGILIAIGFLLVKGVPIELVKVSGRLVMKVTVGVLFLFFFNVFGASFGLHIPINIFTASIVGLLGVPGMACLTAIDVFLL